MSPLWSLSTLEGDIWKRSISAFLSVRPPIAEVEIEALAIPTLVPRSNWEEIKDRGARISRDARELRAGELGLQREDFEAESTSRNAQQKHPPFVAL